MQTITPHRGCHSLPMYRCWFSLLWHYVLILWWLLHWSLLLSLLACSICLFVIHPCSVLLHRYDYRSSWHQLLFAALQHLVYSANEIGDMNANNITISEDVTANRHIWGKNTTNSLLYFSFVQSVTCKFVLRWEKYKQEQPLIKMSQLTNVFILVFILLVDCKWQNLKKGTVLSDICT